MQQELQRDVSLQARQGSTDAVMDPVGKGEVPLRFSADVETIRISKATIVAVRCTVEDIHVGGRGYFHSGENGVRNCDTFGYLKRRFKSKHLLNSRRNLVQVVTQPASLLR